MRVMTTEWWKLRKYLPCLCLLLALASPLHALSCRVNIPQYFLVQGWKLKFYFARNFPRHFRFLILNFKVIPKRFVSIFQPCRLINIYSTAIERHRIVRYENGGWWWWWLLLYMRVLLILTVIDVLIMKKISERWLKLRKVRPRAMMSLWGRKNQ